MTSVPFHSNLNCPEWKDDVSPSQSAEYVQALNDAYQHISQSAIKGEISIEELKAWHKILFQHFVPLEYYAGNYRQHNVSMPCLAVNVKVSNILGSHYPAVIKHLDDLFCNCMQQGCQLRDNILTLSPSFVPERLATILAFLIGGVIRIHPFLNGNGRTSRLIWAWGLLHYNLPVQCRISPRPDPPYGDIMSEAMRGNYKPLALFILKHIKSYSESN